MALWDDRAAGRRRAPRGRSRFVLLACLLYIAAGASATWPALREADESFLARGGSGHGEATPGDHLQSAYNLWLPGHQLERGRAPWRDPYSFQPESEPLFNFQGIVFGFAYWPLEQLLGAVGAWNAFTLLCYVLSGGLGCAWLRALGLSREAAVAGGLVFALAPYRVAQSTGHMLGPVSALLALALYGIERARARATAGLTLAGLGLAAIPLSGQLHLALGAIPLFVAYAALRLRMQLGAAVALAAVAAGIGGLVSALTVPGSVAAGGRSLSTVERYSAEWSDLASRDIGVEIEEFVFLGWLTPVLGTVGLALLLVQRRRGLAAVLGVAAVVPILLGLGTNLPTYDALWHALPPFRFPRVPERLMPITCLALAALVAVALASWRSRLVPLLALPLLLLDLDIDAYRPTTADPRNGAYAAMGGEGGRLLELPVILPQRHFGSPYLYYLAQAPREHPGGYSTVAPREAEDVARRLSRLNCGYWNEGGSQLVARLGIRYVTVHDGLYENSPVVPDCRRAGRRGLRRHGFRLVARDGVIALYARRSSGAAAAP
jgi:hypothetical protein